MFATRKEIKNSTCPCIYMMLNILAVPIFLSPLCPTGCIPIFPNALGTQENPHHYRLFEEANSALLDSYRSTSSIGRGSDVWPKLSSEPPYRTLLAVVVEQDFNTQELIAFSFKREWSSACRLFGEIPALPESSEPGPHARRCKAFTFLAINHATAQLLKCRASTRKIRSILLDLLHQLERSKLMNEEYLQYVNRVRIKELKESKNLSF